jgi:dimethylglycine dehydrogenase
MAGLSDEDFTLPFLSVRQMDIARVPAVVARLSVTGELGYEIHVPLKFVVGLAEELYAAAEGLDARDIGVYALNSLRLEKSYGIWSREYTRDYTPRASGLWRYVDYDKHRFIGRDAALRDRDTVPAKRLVTFAIDTKGADAWGFEPVWFEGRPVGYTTSGGYGHSVNNSLAMGYLRSDLIDSQTALEISIVGEKRPAHVLDEPAYDPAGARLRL